MTPTDDVGTAGQGVALSEVECRRLLGTESIGRVGLTSGGLPCILPVSYLVKDDAILFRTGGGTKLRAAESGDVLAFEVDHFDPETGSGWSVLALGRATVHERVHGDPRGRDHLVALHCEILTGRSVQLVP
jgi:nitroimidazol reductase NimA-like FMN-containing flavoprotein (pyridoxamine 5'-phosphate oxidase superfamily)